MHGERRRLATVYPPCGAQRLKRAELLRAFDRHPGVELVPASELAGREPDIVVLELFMRRLFTPHAARAVAKLSRRAVTVLHSGEACVMDLRALATGPSASGRAAFRASGARRVLASAPALRPCIGATRERVGAPQLRETRGAFIVPQGSGKNSRKTGDSEASSHNDSS